MNARVSEKLRRSIVEHYEGRLSEHGPTARGMDWKDEASQRLRFSVLCEICDLDGRSVHEVGCGAGHLVDLLAERASGARYSGSDLSPAMVAAARERHPAASFQLRDALADPGEQFDVVLCSGLFHVKLDRPEAEWRSFVELCLHSMFDSSRVGIAFNLMSTHVDFRSPDLFYADPAWTLEFCRDELSPWVVLRHDYPLYEYTTYVYRDAPQR